MEANAGSEGEEVVNYAHKYKEKIILLFGMGITQYHTPFR